MAKKVTEAILDDPMLDAQAYEFAFHILPTVAEAEVSGVLDTLKSLVTSAGGEVFDSEAPQRIELAYEIDKVVDGVHKRFHSAYFGWVRMTIQAEGLTRFQEELAHNANVLRSLIVKLSKEEIETPFKYHAQAGKGAKASDTPADDVAVEEVPVAEVAAETTETTTA